MDNDEIDGMYKKERIGWEVKFQPKRNNMIKGITVATKCQKNFQLSQENLHSIVERVHQEESEFFAMLEEQRKKDEADPSVVVKRSEIMKLQNNILELEEKNREQQQKITIYEDLFKKMAICMNMQHKAPKMIGGIKLYE